MSDHVEIVLVLVSELERQEGPYPVEERVPPIFCRLRFDHDLLTGDPERLARAVDLEVDGVLKDVAAHLRSDPEFRAALKTAVLHRAKAELEPA